MAKMLVRRSAHPALICHDERRPPAFGLAAPNATLTIQLVLSHLRERLIVQVTRRLHLPKMERVVGQRVAGVGVKTAYLQGTLLSTRLAPFFLFLIM